MGVWSLAVAYSYLRMSTAEQLKGDSRRRQLAAAHAWAAERNCVLDESLQDIGVSAHRGKHRTKGALAGFLKAISDGRVKPGSYLLIENMDRLSREPVMTAFDTFRDIIRAGIIVVPLDLKWELDELLLNRESWRINALISIMQRAHDESALKAERGLCAIATKRLKAAEGVAYTRTGPAWLKLDEGRRWIPIPERTAIVREMFELAATGAGSYRIAIEFNRKGHPTFGGAAAWGSSYVSKTLRNEAVVGTWQPHKEVDGKAIPIGDPIPGYFPAVIDKALWLTVQRVTIPRNSPGAKGKHFTNLFTGRCHCGACGGPMHVFSVAKKNRNRFSYLVCSNKARGLGCTAKRNFRLDLIEDAVLRTIDVDLERIVADGDAQSRARTLGAQLGEAEYRHDLITRSHATILASLDYATPETMPIVMGRLNAKTAEMQSVAEEVSRLRAEVALNQQSRGDVAANLVRLRETLAAAAPEEKYDLRQRLSNLLKEFVNRLECDPEANVVRVRSGRTDYEFTGAGELNSIVIPRPPLSVTDLEEWRAGTQQSVIERDGRLAFRTVESAVMFKLAFAA